MLPLSARGKAAKAVSGQMDEYSALVHLKYMFCWSRASLRNSPLQFSLPLHLNGVRHILRPLPRHVPESQLRLLVILTSGWSRSCTSLQ